MELSIGARLHVAQKEGLATHLLLDSTHGTKALCGTDVGDYPSYYVQAIVRRAWRLEYVDGTPCLHHVDCKRCGAMYYRAAQTPPAQPAHSGPTPGAAGGAVDA